MAEAGGDPGCGLVEHRNPGRKNPPYKTTTARLVCNRLVLCWPGGCCMGCALGKGAAAGVVAADVSVLSTGGRAGSVKKESETSLACSLSFLFCAHPQVTVEVSVRVTFTRNN